METEPSLWPLPHFRMHYQSLSDCETVSKFKVCIKTHLFKQAYL